MKKDGERVTDESNKKKHTKKTKTKTKKPFRSAQEWLDVVARRLRGNGAVVKTFPFARSMAAAT